MTFSTGCLDIRHRLPDTKVEEVLTRRKRHAGCLGVSTPRDSAYHPIYIIPEGERKKQELSCRYGALAERKCTNAGSKSYSVNVGQQFPNGKRSEAEAIVHRDGDLLLRPEVTLRRLDRRVPQQELDLFQIAATLPTELRASTPEVVRPEALNPDLLC